MSRGYTVKIKKIYALGIIFAAMGIMTEAGLAQGKAGGKSSVLITLSGKLSGNPQTLSGSNTPDSITAGGDYVLTMGLTRATLSCPEQPGGIPWEPGLVLFVQDNTPRSGGLGVTYQKTSSNAGHVDSWRTHIGSYDYQVNFFRWSSENFVDNSDGSSTVLYRGGSIEVFKKKPHAQNILSREQCFGNYVDYDLNALSQYP